ncbi:MAG: GNAT family N-acetyltransferase [Lyngbya sp.]|nr:GNAT family N-acetyltransferase [Lyngbya sp.]
MVSTGSDHLKLEITVATREDLPHLNELYAQMDDLPLLPDEKIEELFNQIHQIPNYKIYLVWLEEKPVGTFSLLYVPTMMHRGFHQFAVLDAVSVASAYRSQGIGKAMIRSALKLSAEAGCYKVTLSSNLHRDRAHAFYESLGFQQHGWSFSLKVVPEI